MTKKKRVVIDSAGNPIECFTVLEAARYLEITKNELLMYLFSTGRITYYHVRSESGSKVVRIRKQDLDDYKKIDELYERIADKITEARKNKMCIHKGMTREELAKELGVHPKTIWYIERYKRRPGVKLLKRICKILDVDFSYLVR